jgi:hypothetical protein
LQFFVGSRRVFGHGSFVDLRVLCGFDPQFYNH